MFAPRRWARVILTLLLFTLSPLSASAQPDDDPTTKAARARFEEGVRYYDKGQYENARAAFLQAYALKHHPAVLLNLAQSSLKSKHYLEAHRYFGQFLHEATSATPEQKGIANKGMADARSELGAVTIEAPDGAEISVDGTRHGKAPLADPIIVEPGPHEFAAKSSGATETKGVSVTRGAAVTVTFGSGESAAVTPPPAAGGDPTAPPDSDVPPPEQPPPGSDTEPPSDAKSTNLLSPPKQMLPVYLGAGAAALGITTAIVFAIFKSDAQSSAEQVEADIRNNGGTSGTCSSTDAATVRKFGAACDALRSNLDKVDTNATMANIGVGVAIVGAATAVGWYLFAPKRDGDTKSAAGRRPKEPSGPELMPLVGRGTMGLQIGGSF